MPYDDIHDFLGTWWLLLWKAMTLPLGLQMFDMVAGMTGRCLCFDFLSVPFGAYTFGLKTVTRHMTMTETPEGCDKRKRGAI